MFGLFLSSAASSLPFLYVSFSVTVGLGLGVANMPAVDIVKQYFVQKPTLPLGLAVSGVGFGMLICPALNEYTHYVKQRLHSYNIEEQLGLSLFL